MKTRWICCALLICFVQQSLFAQIQLPKLISDGMVLQRDQIIPIWGSAKNASVIRIQFHENVFETNVGADGKWSFEWPAMPEGGPYNMEIYAFTFNEKVDTVIKVINDSTVQEVETVVSLILTDSAFVEDILIGDVWLCSGQSNMEMPMRRVEKLYAEVMRNANAPLIKYFDVPVQYSFLKAKNDLSGGKWLPVTPETIREFSAVAYFFATNIQASLDIPIGIIEASLGGSPAEAWISEERLQAFSYHYAELQRLKKKDFIEGVEMTDRLRTNNWYANARKKDSGYMNATQPWYSTKTDAADWKTFNVPGYWKDGSIGNINGIVWFTKTIHLDHVDQANTATIELGAIVDADSVWVNGVFVGTTSYMYPPRIYTIPAGILQEGENIITVRVISNIGDAGFVPQKPYELRWDSQALSLEGEWKYQIGAMMTPLKPPTSFRWKPTGLYNDMIHPLIQYPIKGVVWYQGESNTSRPIEYEQLMITLIENWRSDWKQPHLPFLIVQLANYMKEQSQPVESHWAHTRNAQYNLSYLPNVFVAPAIDLGEWNDIHPLNKKDLSDRLAAIAKNRVYGAVDIVASGPVYSHMEVIKDTVVLHFKNTGSALIAKDGKELTYFSIAGVDQKFVWAKAWIEGDVVKVYSPSVRNPQAVRYAWADNPATANLYNEDGWPCFPFRTDDWAFIP
jgi:sialate O-acetylesterase